MKPRCRDVALACGLASLLGAAGAQTAAGPVEQVNVRAVARFGFDQTGLAESDQAQLLDEVGKIKGVTWQSVQAVGHTDSVGQDVYNRRLSERRAQAVKAYLVSKGLAPEMIRAEGVAADTPVASNDTPAGRAKNRRTEVRFSGVRTGPP